MGQTKGAAAKQAAIAIAKKKRKGKKSAGKTGSRVGNLLKSHRMDINRDGKINKKDFKMMRGK